MRARDTSRTAHDLQLRLYRGMTPEQRSELALRMSDDVRRIAAEGIKQRHPDYSEHDIRRALVALLYGKDAAAKIWPGERCRRRERRGEISCSRGRALDEAGVPYISRARSPARTNGAPRATQDIDIVVDPTFDSPDRFLDAIEGDDVYCDMDVARDEFKGAASSRHRRLQRGRSTSSFGRRDLSARRRWRAALRVVLGVNVFVATEDTI